MTFDLGNVTIDDDDLSDEYDFMDEDDQAEQRRAQEKARKRGPRHKYKEMLQEIADRKINEVVIDLDDIVQVRLTLESFWSGVHWPPSGFSLRSFFHSPNRVDNVCI